ncbi:retrovirus-related pol polyprotein from transposon TNT 1-94 [Tanacetum coccineum]
MDEGTQIYSLDHKLAGTNLSVLVDKTKSARDGLKTTHTDSSTNEESRANEISKKIKLEDLSDLIKDTRSAFFTFYSPQDELIIISDKSDEEETKKDEDTHITSHDVPKDTSVPHPPSLKPAQIQELMAQVHLLQSQKEKLEQQKAKAEAEVASLKARPHIQISTSLLNFCLTSQVAELKNIQWELPTEFLELPSQVSSVQVKLKTLDSLPSLLNKVTDTFNRFATMVETASGATSKNVPSAGQATASPAKGEKNTNPAIRDVEPTNMHNELVDLLGINIVTQYYNKKLLYDKYHDKMLKRRKSSKIINYDALTQKVPITLQVVQACPNRKEKGWKTIYGLIKTRMEYLNQTKKELKIDFNKPLKEQDPLNELNDLANKKRKRTGDSKDHSRSSNKHKSSVQHEEEVLRRLGNIFTSVYAADQKLKKAYAKSFRKRLLYVKRNKAISLGKGASKVGIEVQKLSLKDCTYPSERYSSLIACSSTESSTVGNEEMEDMGWCQGIASGSFLIRHGTMGGTIHYKVSKKEEGYAKSINVGAVLILRDVSVFTPKPSNYYLNITLRNIVKVFHKDTDF